MVKTHTEAGVLKTVVVLTVVCNFIMSVVYNSPLNQCTSHSTNVILYQSGDLVTNAEL